MLQVVHSLFNGTFKQLFDKAGADISRATGFGFDFLTESEARTVVKFKPADTVRDRIVAEGCARGGRMDGFGTGEAGLSAGSIGQDELTDLMAGNGSGVSAR